MAARVARLFINFKLIYDAHELMPHKQGVTKITSWAIGVFERFSWSKIDQFITVGFKIKDWYLATYGNKIATVIFNSPTPSEKQLLLLEKNYIRARFQIPRKAKIFALAGMFVKGRSIETILDIFARQDNDLHVIFFGFGDMGCMIESAARANTNIHKHEAVPHDDLVAHLEQCDYGLCLIQNVSLSDQLSMPNKLFEYLQAGLPVLASDLPEISAAVRELDAGVLVDNELGSIKAGISSLLKKSNYINREKIADYLWPAQELKLKNLYLSINNEVKGE